MYMDLSQVLYVITSHDDDHDHYHENHAYLLLSLLQFYLVNGHLLHF